MVMPSKKTGKCKCSEEVQKAWNDADAETRTRMVQNFYAANGVKDKLRKTFGWAPSQRCALHHAVAQV